MNTKPCLTCKERHPGCHDACEKYQAAKKYLEDKKAESAAKGVTPSNFVRGGRYV